MKKTALAITIAIILAVGGAFAYSLTNKSQIVSTNENKNITSNKISAENIPNDKLSKQDNNLDKTNNAKTVKSDIKTDNTSNITTNNTNTNNNGNSENNNIANKDTTIKTSNTSQSTNSNLDNNSKSNISNSTDTKKTNNTNNSNLSDNSDPSYTPTPLTSEQQENYSKLQSIALKNKPNGTAFITNLNNYKVIDGTKYYNLYEYNIGKDSEHWVYDGNYSNFVGAFYVSPSGKKLGTQYVQDFSDLNDQQKYSELYQLATEFTSYFSGDGAIKVNLNKTKDVDGYHCYLINWGDKSFYLSLTGYVYIDKSQAFY